MNYIDKSKISNKLCEQIILKLFNFFINGYK